MDFNVFRIGKLKLPSNRKQFDINNNVLIVLMFYWATNIVTVFVHRPEKSQKNNGTCISGIEVCSNIYARNI